jgi:hypothetical protein
MKKLFLIFLLVGCQSTDIKTKGDGQLKESAITNNQQVIKKDYTAEINKLIKEHKAKELNDNKIKSKQEQLDLANKINKLNKAGKGSLNICKIKSHDNTINVDYSNELGKKLVFRVYDEYIINSVSLWLDKSKATSFIDFIKKSSDSAVKNKDLENLSLGTFTAGSNWVMFSSRHGNISGFWGNDWVDQILTSIDTKKITDCARKVQTFL